MSRAGYQTGSVLARELGLPAIGSTTAWLPSSGALYGEVTVIAAWHSRQEGQIELDAHINGASPDAGYTLIGFDAGRPEAQRSSTGRHLGRASPSRATPASMCRRQGTRPAGR
jgi:hypothetical protein